MKKCKICLETKDFSNFGKEPRVRDGLQARCTECKNKAGKKWNLENIEKQRNSLKKWRIKNPEKLLIYNDRYREAKRETNKIWHSKNKDKNRAYLRARRARIKGSSFEFFTEIDLLKTKVFSKFKKSDCKYTPVVTI